MVGRHIQLYPGKGAPHWSVPSNSAKSLGPGSFQGKVAAQLVMQGRLGLSIPGRSLRIRLGQSGPGEGKRRQRTWEFHWRNIG